MSKFLSIFLIGAGVAVVILPLVFATVKSFIAKGKEDFFRVYFRILLRTVETVLAIGVFFFILIASNIGIVQEYLIIATKDITHFDISGILNVVIFVPSVLLEVLRTVIFTLLSAGIIFLGYRGYSAIVERKNGNKEEGRSTAERNRSIISSDGYFARSAEKAYIHWGRFLS